jgi:uncharacterized protein YecT (DUF1311 family)
LIVASSLIEFVPYAGLSTHDEGSAFAQVAGRPQKKPKGLCDDEMTQTGLNVCFANAYKSEESRLKVTYNHYLTILSSTDKTNLLTAQEAWLRYRDAECKAVADQFEGGSMQPMQFSSCMYELTLARIRELNDDYKMMYSE